eukprot:scaffold2043_cov166-Amphora_coffeaeformis.AAC.8
MHACTPALAPPQQGIIDTPEGLKDRTVMSPCQRSFSSLSAYCCCCCRCIVENTIKIAMKFPCSLATFASLSGASAWVVQTSSRTTSTRQHSTTLNAEKHAWTSAAAAAVAGWALSGQIVSASIPPSGACGPYLVA